MRIVKDPDERKQEILDAAIRVFARKGYEHTTISDVAKEIGVSQGLCYRYFPSKEAMYDAAIDEYAEYIATQNLKLANINPHMPLKEQIYQISGRMGEYMLAEKKKSNLYELFHKEGNHKLHNELFLRVAQKLVPYVTRTLETAIDRGEISVKDPAAMARFCVFGQVGILMDRELTQEEQSQQIQDCLMGILGLQEKR